MLTTERIQLIYMVLKYLKVGFGLAVTKPYVLITYDYHLYDIFRTLLQSLTFNSENFEITIGYMDNNYL
jgi:hypothetical protein